MAECSSRLISQQTQNFCITFIQRRPNVFDVGPTLYKRHTHVLCLMENQSLAASHEGVCHHNKARINYIAMPNWVRTDENYSLTR